MKKILLSETNPDAYMEVYAEPSEKAKPAVLIYPGGGYYALSDTERLPIVEFYRENGFQTFIIMYSIGIHAHYPDPLTEGSKAVWEIRKNAGEYCVNPDQITLREPMLQLCWQISGIRTYQERERIYRKAATDLMQQ